MYLSRAAAAAIVLAAAPAAIAQESAARPLSNLLDRMSENGKRRFLWDDEVTRLFESSRVQATSTGAEADSSFAFGLELLAAAELAVVSVETGGATTYRVVPAAAARALVQKTCHGADELPAANEYARLQVRVRNLRARDVMNVLQALLTDPRNIQVQEEGEVLILTDYAQTLRRIAEFIAAVDVPATEAQSWRVSIAIVESGGEGSPLAEDMPLPKVEAAAGRKGFREAGRGMAAMTTGASARSSGTRAMVKVDRLADVTLQGARAGGDVLLVESLDVRESTPAEGQERSALSARVSLRKGEWVVAGTMPARKPGETWVVLARADRDE